MTSEHGSAPANAANPPAVEALPPIGGAIAASFGLHWVFLMTAIVMAANLVWVYRRIPEYGSPAP